VDLATEATDDPDIGAFFPAAVGPTSAAACWRAVRAANTSSRRARCNGSCNGSVLDPADGVAEARRDLKVDDVPAFDSRDFKPTT
jgi:hypothetical protein